MLSIISMRTPNRNVWFCIIPRIHNTLNCTLFLYLLKMKYNILQLIFSVVMLRGSWQTTNTKFYELSQNYYSSNVSTTVAEATCSFYELMRVEKKMNIDPKTHKIYMEYEIVECFFTLSNFHLLLCLFSHFTYTQHPFNLR